MNLMRTPEQKKYTDQKSKAKHRTIEFNLTFEEWWSIWQQSGKWEQRGIRKDQYVMSRIADKGGYEIGNVEIKTTGGNIREAYATHRTGPMLGKKHSEETISKMKGRPSPKKGKATPIEVKNKISKSLTGRPTGRTSNDFTPEWREKLKGPKQKIKCPHCSLEGSPSNMHRWHFDNCKSINTM
jgi:hypothetical protein